MDDSKEKELEESISPEHHPARRQRGQLPSVPFVSVTTRGDDCYDSGVGEFHHSHTAPLYEGVNTLGVMETDVDGEVAYSVNYAPTAKVKNGESTKKAPDVCTCVSVGTCTCISVLVSVVALLMVLAVIACGLLIYFGILPLDSFATAAQVRQLQANITASSNQADETAKQLDRLTAELAALQAATAQLSTVVSVLRASLNGSNGSTASYPHAEVPQSYPATLANMTLYQNCTTRVVSTCSLLQGVTGAFCQTSTYTLSANDYQTIDVFCATANTGEIRPLVATLDLYANVARCLCYVVSAQPSTAITACNLYATECPVINSFATIVQP